MVSLIVYNHWLRLFIFFGKRLPYFSLSTRPSGNTGSVINNHPMPWLQNEIMIVMVRQILLLLFPLSFGRKHCEYCTYAFHPLKKKFFFIYKPSNHWRNISGDPYRRAFRAYECFVGVKRCVLPKSYNNRWEKTFYSEEPWAKWNRPQISRLIWKNVCRPSSTTSLRKKARKGKYIFTKKKIITRWRYK